MNHKKPLAMGAVLLGLFVFGASPSRCAERDWTIITLDAEGNAGRYADLQMDLDGNLYVAYLRADNSTLRVMTRDGGVWGAPQTIDASGSVNGYCALAVTPDGDLPVSYRRDGSGELWYAGPQVSRTWVAAPITAETDDVGRELMVERQVNGDLALAFRNQTDGSLLHMRREAGAWTAIETVDAGPNRGQYCDLTYRLGVGYAFSEYMSDGSALAFADPVIAPRPWASTPITTESDDVGRGLMVERQANGDLALAFRNQTDGSLLHMRREGGAWTAIETVDAGPNRGQYCDVTHRPGIGYAFSEYMSDGSALAFADPVIEARFWRSEALDHYEDVGRQLSMVVGPLGRLNYTYLGSDVDHGWHIRAGEYLPDSVRILRPVADSVAVSGTEQVTPDIFLTPGQNWYLSFRNAVDHHLYFAMTESLQIVEADVDEPWPDAPGPAAVEAKLLGAQPNPAAGRLRIYYTAPIAGPAELLLLDPSGRVVRRIQETCRRGTNRIDFDDDAASAPRLAAGVYFVRLRIGDTWPSPKRLVLTR